uniref:uncharacterized protein LOC117156692 n=1 Tax=Bombus vancouverensis nearcticus TaxID=2705178 RepID=UPI00143A6E45|nr:uncharacterized protein LOC117156692 [Bombus vancouverensis nearcticus]XP_033191415.1 uncharacterized protein LOC117157482 [Bombus vancouverensis nearcticus]
MDQISQAVPADDIELDILNLPEHIPLADRTFYRSSGIDGLIGAQLFWDLLREGRIVSANPTLQLRNTELGWIVTGETVARRQPQTTNCNVTLQALQEEVHKFWTIEEGPSRRRWSSEEQACETHYVTHTTREATGRYKVRLPFKNESAKLGDTYQLALKRFLSLEHSLQQRPTLKTQYHEFLREYETLGHMSELPNDSRDGCYLPHHPVLKSDSVTTKVRVIFDASARSSAENSLNELFMVGPTIQDDLCSLLLRFRTYKYVLAADIAKVYRQINMHPNDRPYQKILWREDINEPIRIYRLNTVTYGTAPAPYLAVRTLHQLTQDEEPNYPVAAQTLTQDFYVDDLLTGENSLEKARALRDQLIDVNRKGGFELRQWISNEAQLLAPLRRKSDQSNHLSLDDKGTTKTLGLQWTATQDRLEYSSSQPTKAHKALWKGHVEWDEVVPRDIQAAWTSFQAQIQRIHRITIPRRVTIADTVDVQLHGFADASERAYGACIYIRSTDNTNRHQTFLLCSKSRIAPLKTQTLPQLELCAAVLLIKLVRSVTKALTLTFRKIILWSDSTIVLHWINTPPHTLKTFVANRVTEILQGSTEKLWRHEPSEDNAADTLSRGAELDDLIHHKTWYQGPHWLEPEDAWPREELTPIEIPEQRRVITLQTSTPTDLQILERFSSFPLLTRVVAYCLRFANNTRQHSRRGGQLTIEELDQATCRVIRLLQKTAFPTEMQDLRATSPPSKSNRLISLSPFLDAEGIIRVGGRLAHSGLRYEQKHLAVLPPQHHLTNLIIRETHIRQGHSGVQGTLHVVRQAYWPINGRVAVKAAIRKCVICRRMQARAPQYPILPANRVKLERPFLVVGIDANNVQGSR